MPIETRGPLRARVAFGQVAFTIALTVGGLNPSGGAGILQGARTIEDVGARAMAVAVATAWTAQSSHGVESWEPAPVEYELQNASSIAA
jgi:hydroxymethylpyrimidine/phosphomethylpyrimidine kinase